MQQHLQQQARSKKKEEGYREASKASEVLQIIINAAFHRCQSTDKEEFWYKEKVFLLFYKKKNIN